MNDTRFAIYSSGVVGSGEGGGTCVDMKALPLTRELYVRNCDRRAAGNLSSIYQTLIALLNLSRGQFHYDDEIVNTFLEKLQGTMVRGPSSGLVANGAKRWGASACVRPFFSLHSRAHLSLSLSFFLLPACRGRRWRCTRRRSCGTSSASPCPAPSSATSSRPSSAAARALALRPQP